MRAPRLLSSLVSLWVGLCGCMHLPAIGFGVRSSFRSDSRPLHRTVELLTGMTVGWSGARQQAHPIASASDDAGTDAAEISAPRFESTEAPCAAAVFCDWESDQRSAALAREGFGDPVGDLEQGAQP